jgi:hypothetical protein
LPGQRGDFSAKANTAPRRNRRFGSKIADSYLFNKINGSQRVYFTIWQGIT